MSDCWGILHLILLSFCIINCSFQDKSGHDCCEKGTIEGKRQYENEGIVYHEIISLASITAFCEEEFVAELKKYGIGYEEFVIDIVVDDIEYCKYKCKKRYMDGLIEDRYGDITAFIDELTIKTNVLCIPDVSIPCSIGDKSPPR